MQLKSIATKAYTFIHPNIEYTYTEPGTHTLKRAAPTSFKNRII